MNLSLSGRLWETPRGIRTPLAEQFQVAGRSGYKGMEIRYPLLPCGEEIPRTLDLLEANGLEVAMAFQGKIPSTCEEWRDAERVMDTSQALGIRFNRVAIMSEEQLPSVRELACRSADRGVGLLLHLHINTWCDSPARILRAVESVNHPGAGVLFDPAHVALAGGTDMEEAIQQLGSLIRFVNIQNFRPAEPHAPDAEIEGYGSSWARTPANDPRGLPLGEIIRLLETAGYRGWFNIIAALDESEDPERIALDYRALFTNNNLNQNKENTL